MNVAIVGAGIVGLAHAWSAAERGHRVTLFERNAAAQGASIRNFGMIWPIGQPAGEWHEMALESRQRWLELGAAAGIWVNPCGSIHLAHRSDEWAVLQEFAAQAESLGFECNLLSSTEVLARAPVANAAGLLGGLFSLTELCVNPRLAMRHIPHWLAERFGVRLAFGTTVISVDPAAGGIGTTLRTTRGSTEPFDHLVVCGGSDFLTLFPDLFSRSELKLCKLQMLKTHPQNPNWRFGPHLASGLTLRHYQNFKPCQSLRILQDRIAAETPELNRFGIHVMAAQNDAGEVILGDSHEYDGDISPFDKSQIDDLILRELHKIICLPDWAIAEQWHGYYVKHPVAPVYEDEPLANIHICTGTGGAGMTMAFGIAERAWRKWSQF
jgi:FAD dependent oxidoreductase TIGR03364